MTVIELLDLLDTDNVVEIYTEDMWQPEYTGDRLSTRKSVYAEREIRRFSVEDDVLLIYIEY